MSQITIAGETFTAPNPFAEGHPLTANEASALNQLLHENLRNNFAKKVKDAKEAGSFDHEALQSSFDQYASTYQFGVRVGGTGGSSRGPADPVLKEAIALAVTAITQKLKASGKKVGGKDGYSSAQIKEAATKLAQDPSKPYMDDARQIVEMRQSVANDSLDDVIGDLGAPETSGPVSLPEEQAAA